MATSRVIFIRTRQTDKNNAGQFLEGWVLSDFASSQWLDQEVIDTYEEAYGEDNVFVVDLPKTEGN